LKGQLNGPLKSGDWWSETETADLKRAAVAGIRSSAFLSGVDQILTPEQIASNAAQGNRRSIQSSKAPRNRSSVGSAAKARLKPSLTADGQR
jgi:hypothetical protein